MTPTELKDSVLDQLEKYTRNMTKEDINNSFISFLPQSQIEELKDSRYVIVLDKAEAPIYRYKPKKRQFVISCGIFGLVLALLYAFIGNFFNEDNKDSTELKSKSLFLQ